MVFETFFLVFWNLPLLRNFPMFYVFPFIQTSASTLWCVHRLLHRDGSPPTAKRLQAIQAIGAIEAIGAIKAIRTTFGWLPSHFRISQMPLSMGAVSLSGFSKSNRGPLSLVAVSLFSKAIGAHFLWALSHFHVSQGLMVISLLKAMPVRYFAQFTIRNILVSVEKCIAWIISNTAAPL